MAFRDEVNAMPIIQAIWQANKICYLPVLQKNKHLFFVRYDENDSLTLNHYGIFEPSDLSKKISTQNLDMVIVPLVAFDATGHRLGTGGGYYDRTFSFLQQSYLHKPYMLGLAYAIQQADHLPTDLWDKALDGVVTEKKVYLFD